VFLVALFAFTMSYEIWKLFRRYDAQMRDHEARMPGLRRPDGEEPGR
jgi:hypothetical protein